MKKVEFGNGKIVQNILSTAFPMLIAQVLSLLYNIVDRIYIGRIPEVGTEALGAVGLCFPVIILITGFTNMFGMGGSPLFSIELGRGNREKARQILSTAFKLLVLTGILLLVFFEVLAAPTLSVFGASKEEMTYALPYLQIYVLGTVFSMVSTGINPYINAEGYSSLGMCTVLLGAVANLVLDPVFIFVLGMGVQGAAVATVISQLLSMLFVCWFLWSGRNEFRIDLKPALPWAGEIISLGLSPFIMQVTNALVSLSCNHVLLRCGGTLYVSVMTTVNSVRQILDTPAQAITEGSSPSISYYYGAGRPESVKKAIRFMMTLTVPYTALIWGLIMWNAPMFIRIFTQDEALVTAAAPALHIYFYAFIFQSLQYAGQTVFKALNKKNHAIFFSLLRKAILVVPLTFLLPYAFGMGTDGVFMAEPISNVIGGLACFITMLATVWPELNRMKEKQGNKAGQ